MDANGRLSVVFNQCKLSVYSVVGSSRWRDGTAVPAGVVAEPCVEPLHIPEISRKAEKKERSAT